MFMTNLWNIVREEWARQNYMTMLLGFLLSLSVQTLLAFIWFREERRIATSHAHRHQERCLLPLHILPLMDTFGDDELYIYNKVNRLNCDLSRKLKQWWRKQDYLEGFWQGVWTKKAPTRRFRTKADTQEPKGYNGNAETDIRSTWHKGMTVVACTEQSELIISLRLLSINH